jgi:hypothetical protein
VRHQANLLQFGVNDGPCCAKCLILRDTI